ncbi:hypothetical protein DDB_G0289431 [Dictyostelium discoideum AX4]|uniref:hypothetical protein n=1 Tax=Dictyostelium discoideum AX4 TaxID=352472 RepID=UPI00004E4957|nr:hypothetical protein DDB_G0289431 [Dictyostelium discoideum AX4]EAL62743.1 hypothetical protein DDB_G0289431 [Dictyostelium discoideum AX4]|eukprot:XP_636249.1 hypothetical protein DDB_G0289431 [Dictyostelium discoideum AX4]
MEKKIKIKLVLIRILKKKKKKKTLKIDCKNIFNNCVGGMVYFELIVEYWLY